MFVLHINCNAITSLHNVCIFQFFAQAFSTKLFFNEDTGHFEQVLWTSSTSNGGRRLGEERERGDRGVRGRGRGEEDLLATSAAYSSTSLSMLYLTDDCMGAVSIGVNMHPFHIYQDTSLVRTLY